MGCARHNCYKFIFPLIHWDHALKFSYLMLNSQNGLFTDQYLLAVEQPLRFLRMCRNQDPLRRYHLEATQLVFLRFL